MDKCKKCEGTGTCWSGVGQAYYDCPDCLGTGEAKIKYIIAKEILEEFFEKETTGISWFNNWLNIQIKEIT